MYLSYVCTAARVRKWIASFRLAASASCDWLPFSFIPIPTSRLHPNGSAR